MKNCSIVLVLLSVSCLSFVPFYQDSPKKILNNYRFVSLRDKNTKNYWVIRDSIHQEYLDNKLFTISKVNWLPGNNYNTVFRWVTIDVDPEIFAPGDTMNMQVLSFYKDTLTLRLHFKTLTREFKYLRTICEE